MNPGLSDHLNIPEKVSLGIIYTLIAGYFTHQNKVPFCENVSHPD